MSHHHKLSFGTAILVNLNIMFGAGIFINTLSLSQLAGFLGFVSYLTVALLLTPLIISIATLIEQFPDGGFYAYAAKSINAVTGFFSAWAYFTGKLASAALLIHVFSTLITTLIPLLSINPFILDGIILCLFTWLNLLHMKTGRALMYTFIFFKLMPILFTVVSCLYVYTQWTIPSATLLWSGLPTTIPLVLFAFAGFEACCSLSGSLENAKKNGPRVLFLSYALVVTVTILYQLLFFLVAGSELMHQKDFLGIFPSLFSVLLPHNPLIAHHIIALLHIAVACASLGGSYGILFSNHWNLYALAQHNHTFFPTWLKKLNIHNIPTACVIIEALFCALYLFITHGTVVTLQQISVLGSSIAFTLSIIGLIKANTANNNTLIAPWISWLALGSCLLFVGACIRNFYLNGITPLLIFSTILLVGLCMYFVTAKMTRASN